MLISFLINHFILNSIPLKRRIYKNAYFVNLTLTRMNLLILLKELRQSRFI